MRQLLVRRVQRQPLRIAGAASHVTLDNGTAMCDKIDGELLGVRLTVLGLRAWDQDGVS